MQQAKRCAEPVWYETRTLLQPQAEQRLPQAAQHLVVSVLVNISQPTLFVTMGQPYVDYGRALTNR